MTRHIQHEGRAPAARSFSLRCDRFLLRVDCCGGVYHLWCQPAGQDQLFWLARTPDRAVMGLWLQACYSPNRSPTCPAWKARDFLVDGTLREIAHMDRELTQWGWDAPLLW